MPVLAPVPAAPTALDPLLRRSGGAARLEPTADTVDVLLLGLDPVTAAAAVQLAGCGVRGFSVVDDGPVTWADARAGAFDVEEVGRPRDLCTRRRIRAASPEAAPVTSTAAFEAEVRPGRVVLRTSRLRETGTGLAAGADAARAPRLQVPADAARLAEGLPLVDVLPLPGRGTLLLPPTPWWRRRCPDCTAAMLREVGEPRAERPGRRSAAPTHTAFAAALVAQAVLDAATAPPVGPAAAAQPAGTALAILPGTPHSLALPVAPPAVGCALCSP